MKKIIPIIIMILIPLITVEKINNKNYYLETETNTYTKEEIDSKINELITKINDNATKITETKNILIEIKNKLNDYALKTSLNKTNEDITTLNELANQNKARIDELENNAKNIKQIGTFTGTIPARIVGQPYTTQYSNSTINAEMPSTSVDDYIIVINSIKGGINNYNYTGNNSSAEMVPKIITVTENSMIIEKTGMHYGANSGIGYNDAGVILIGTVYYIG